MMLRAKLLFAQLPLALALVLVGFVSVRTTQALGSGAQAILQDNYRSVLAAQRMKDALEGLDSAAATLVLGDQSIGAERAQEPRRRFENELHVQEGNITELGEGEATRRLRQSWDLYQDRFDKLAAQTDASQRRALYVDELQPRSISVHAAADEVLSLNQDAMVRKSELARKEAERVDTLLIAATILALLAGVLASTALTARLLRPLSVLTQAARRIGEGDLEARARVAGSDEVSQLASEFNQMADHLRRYRETTLGELLQVQGAAQAAIDSLPDAVVAFDDAGSVLAANQVAERDLKIAMETGPSALAAVEPELRAVLEKLRAHVLAGKGVYQPKGYEEAIRVARPDGDRWLLPRATPVYAEGGGVSGATVLLQDVTRLRRFDELKNDLVATVAHEFRTPLTSLRMAIHLCLEGAAGPLTEKQVDLLQAAREDCERLQGIVDDLLDLSRMQSGRVELERHKVSVRTLLDRAIEAGAPQASERQIALTEEDLCGGAQVDVDPDRLELVFSNLVTNAVRYSPPGAPVILRARPAENAVRFEVVDQGPGVPPEFRERIFEKYFRVPGAPSGSAGLGLYISKEIVLAHGGEIGLEASLPRGSTFWFTVPTQPPATT